jgi:hypothetical protein
LRCNISAQNVLTGAGIILQANGNVVGFATGIQFTRSQNTKVIMEVDSPYAAEIMPTSFTVAGTLTGIRLRDSGGLDGSKIMDLSKVQSIFYQQYTSLVVVDRVTNKNIYTFSKVMFDSDSWTISAKNVITFSASFKAVFITNEAGDNPNS